MFPTSLRATVLDGSIDLNVPSSQQYIVGAKSQEKLLDNVLAECSANAKCAFHNDGNSEQAYDALMTSLDQKPIPAKKASVSRPMVGEGIAAWAVLKASYDQSTWKVLTDALAQAQDGDGAGLLALYDSYLERSPNGTWDNVFEDLLAINCVDNSEGSSQAEDAKVAEQLAREAPRAGNAFAYFDPCLYWPVKASPPLAVTGKGAGTILVVGSTGDPVTPLESTRGMAKALEGGTLLIRDGEGHTSYATGNNCIDDAVDTYLIDLIAPADGTTCPG
jgi:pimeloyl-ACP methyl ester carboxylesterase